MIDIRKAPNGQQVTAVFFALTDSGQWETFGSPQMILPRQPFVHSEVVQEPVRTLAGIIYWDEVPVFKSKPMMCLRGDTFTFNLGDSDE